MRRTLAAALIATLGIACGILTPGDSTRVSGRVYLDGTPVAGVHVDLRLYEGTPFLTGGDGDVTDSTGHYQVSYAETDCGGYLQATGPARSISVVEDTPRPSVTIDCGERRTGVDFHFTGDFWYVGASITALGGYVQDLGDTLAVVDDNRFRLYGRLVISRTPMPGAIHADSSEWVWRGSQDFDWETSGSASLADATDYDGDEWYRSAGNYRDVWAQSVGVATVVGTLAGSPFADTVWVRVDPAP